LARLRIGDARDRFNAAIENPKRRELRAAVAVIAGEAKQ
jgi:hypothetical protein